MRRVGSKPTPRASGRLFTAFFGDLLTHGSEASGGAGGVVGKSGGIGAGDAEAVALFLRGGELAGRLASVRRIGDGSRFLEDAEVDVVPMPERRISAQVMRRVFLAVVGHQRVKVRYFSVHGAEERWRWIQPRAFAHNGLRWHVRAWCETNAEHRDFVVGRCSGAEWPEAVTSPAPRDDAWAERTVLQLCPHPSLDAAQRQAVEREYGMQGGVLRLEVRRAMENYVRERLGLPLWDGQPAKARLEVNEPPLA